jgi:phosphoserine phosphatase RsbU/P
MADRGAALLLIEDNPGDARLIEQMLKEAQPEATLAWAHTVAEGLALLQAGSFSAVLLDLFLPDSRGLDTLRTLIAESSLVPVVVITGHPDKAVAGQALREGAQDYLIKGQITPDLLAHTIGNAIERHSRYASLRSLALLDPLTGLYNRQGFAATAGQLLQLAQRTHKRLYVSLIDIDHSESISPLPGSEQINVAIDDAAAVLRETFRGSDVLARLGDDRFAALSIELSPGTAEALRARLYKILAELQVQHKRHYRLSLSMGTISCDPGSGWIPEELLSRADAYFARKKETEADTAGSGTAGLRVLLIEDNPGDARLIRELLAESKGTMFDVQTAGSLAAGLQLLAQTAYDVLLLDLNLPDSWGNETITSVIRATPRIPVVVLTGTAEEETGVTAIKYGAQDYLIKGSFTGDTLTRSIAHAIERKKTENDIKRLSLVASRTDNAVIITDAAGRIEWVNEGFTRISGYTLAEVAGKTPGSFLQGPETDPGTVARMHDQLSRNEGFDVEIINYNQQGKPYWVAIEVRPVFDASGAVVNYMAIESDITERRRAEELLRRAREQEVSIASRIQQTLLIGEPPRDLPGIDLAVFSLPSQQVDGDFYDFIRHGNSCVDILLGDVMGKGVAAALLGAAAKSYFLRAHNRLMHTASHTDPPALESVIAEMNGYMAAELMHLESFITLNYTRLDTARRTLQFIDCGHTKTVYYQAAEKRCLLLEGSNMPLGFSREDAYEARSISFAPGDIFFFYSDGLSEARNAAGEQFGEQRIMELVANNTSLSAEGIIRTLCDAAGAFSGARGFSDDLTCLAVIVREELHEEPRQVQRFAAHSSLVELSAIRSFVKNFCCQEAAPPLSDESASSIELAVNEAAANIMKHAYHGSTAGRIEIEARDHADRIIILLRHRGEPLDRKQVGSPHFDGTAEGGFGIFIIEQCADTVRYSSDNQGTNEIVLTKYKHKQ